MLAYGSTSRHSIVLQRLRILNSKPSNFHGLRGFDGNHLELLLKRRRERLECEDKVSTLDEAVQVKKVKKSRDSDGYDPKVSRESNWYNAYVGPRSELCMNPLKKRGKKFRRRFRMPMKSFKELMIEIRQDNWFPTYEKKNALGDIGVPLDLLVLGSLRYLGRGWTFDDLEDVTGISEEVHRRFFHLFVAACTKYLFPKYVVEPTTAEEIEDAISEFKEAGFDGCIGSADATHVIMEKCTARLKNQHLGGKMPHTARAFEITVNHRRRILATTVGFPGRWNDKTIVRFDGFINRIHRGLLYEDVKYKLYKLNGKQISVKGAWILVDGGYLRWSCTIPPYKQYASVQEERWSK